MVEYGGQLHYKDSHLIGIPWPSEELNALFNMVPDKRIRVSWIMGLSEFHVSRYNSATAYSTIHAKGGHDIDLWREVLVLGLSMQHVHPVDL